jgi:hypothetical protein
MGATLPLNSCHTTEDATSMNVYITSLVEQKYRDDLEELLYFNPQQSRYRNAIVKMVERYGSPRILERDGYLRLQLDRLEEVQTLYAMVRVDSIPTLAGAVVYARTQDGGLEILHIVVKQQYAMSSQGCNPGVALSLIEEVARTARKVRGIGYVRLAYNGVRVLPSWCGPSPEMGSSTFCGSERPRRL